MTEGNDSILFKTTCHVLDNAFCLCLPWTFELLSKQDMSSAAFHRQFAFEPYQCNAFRITTLERELWSSSRYHGYLGI